MSGISAKRAFDIETGIAKSASCREGNVMTSYRTPQVWTAFLSASTEQDVPLARAKGVLCSIVLTFLIGILASPPAAAQTRQEGDFVLKDFTFHDGSKLAALSLHYITWEIPRPRRFWHSMAHQGTAHRCCRPILAARCLAPASRWMQPSISSSCRT